MKTKDLIKQLQELDPSGEVEVVGYHGDIYLAEFLPAYWDGVLGVLIRDEEKQKEGYYHIKGMRFCSKGSKIVLHEMSARNVVWDQAMNEMVFEYDSEYAEKHKKPMIEAEQKEYQEYLNSRNKNG